MIGLQTHAGSPAIGIGNCVQSNHDGMEACTNGTYHRVYIGGDYKRDFIQGGIYNTPTIKQNKKVAIRALFD